MILLMSYHVIGIIDLNPHSQWSSVHVLLKECNCVCKGDVCWRVLTIDNP